MSEAVAVAIIAAMGLTLNGLIGAAALMQSRETHKLFNSRMDELLTLTRAEARAEGVAAGEQAQRDRASTQVQP